MAVVKLATSHPYANYQRRSRVYGGSLNKHFYHHSTAKLGSYGSRNVVIYMLPIESRLLYVYSGSSECIVHAPHQSWYNMGNFWLNESNSELPFCTGFLQCCTVVAAAAHRPAAS
jgi:hypothetical protein